MKIFIPSLCVATPHFETELEIIEKHITKNDDVHYLKCCGEYDACFMYGKTDPLKCFICQKKFENGVRLLSKKIYIIYHNKLSSLQKSDIPIFNNVEELKTYHYKNVNIGMGVASYLISKFENEGFDTVQYADIISQLVVAAYCSYCSIKKKMQDVKPDIVYLFNGRNFIQSEVVSLCKELRIPFFTHEICDNFLHYRLVKNALPHILDNIPKECEQLYVQYGAEKAHILAEKEYILRRTGNEKHVQSFTKAQTQGRLPINFDKNKKNIVIFNSSIFEFAAIPDLGSPTGYYASESAFLMQLAESFREDDTVHFYFRVHPNLANKRTPQLDGIYALTELFSNLTIIFPEDPTDSYSLMDHAEKIIVFHSTTGAEASYWGKPVIVLGLAAYKALDGFYTPQTHEELVQLLQQDLRSNPLGATKFGLWLQKQGVPYDYYIPAGRYKGKFKSVDLMQLTVTQNMQRAFYALILLAGFYGKENSKMIWHKIKYKVRTIFYKNRGIPCQPL